VLIAKQKTPEKMTALYSLTIVKLRSMLLEKTNTLKVQVTVAA
jgi:hypothetical protein